MHEDEFKDIALAGILGIVIAATMVMFIERVPQVTVNSLYLQVQYAVFAAFVGTLPAVRYRSETARGNLTTVALFITCLVTSAGVLMRGPQPNLIFIDVFIFAVITVGAGASAYFDLVSAAMLFKTSLFLGAIVYSFVSLYLVLIQLQSGLQTYLILIPLSTLAYYALARGTRKELTAVGG